VRHPNTDEKDLLRRAQAGSTGAFDELVRRLTPRLFRIVRRMASDAAQAEALVQETWLRAWRALPGWRESGEPIAWLATIAVNLARDAWRKKAPIDFADLSEAEVERATEAPGPEERLEYAQDLGRLADCVQRLRPEHRTVIALRYDAGLEYQEIARTMGIPVNTVRTHLRRAKQQLLSALEAGDDRSAG